MEERTPPKTQNFAPSVLIMCRSLLCLGSAKDHWLVGLRFGLGLKIASSVVSRRMVGSIGSGRLVWSYRDDHVQGRASWKGSHQ